LSLSGEVYPRSYKLKQGHHLPKGEGIMDVSFFGGLKNNIEDVFDSSQQTYQIHNYLTL